jgi:hypothetical protein
MQSIQHNFLERDLLNPLDDTPIKNEDIQKIVDNNVQIYRSRKEPVSSSSFKNEFSSCLSSSANTNSKISFVIKKQQKYVKRGYFLMPQTWTCHIISIDKENEQFDAKLEQKDSSTYEIATFDFKDIAQEDAEFFKLGAIFYWMVGYENRNGQISKTSSIRFKRTVWKLSDYDSIIDDSVRMFDDIQWA